MNYDWSKAKNAIYPVAEEAPGCGLPGYEVEGLHFFFVLFIDGEDGVERVDVTHDMMSFWGKTLEDIRREAERRPVVFPLKLPFLDEDPKDDSGVLFSEPLIMTNDRCKAGAGLLLYTSALESVRVKMGGKDFYILPSSVHEVIIMPHDLMNPDELYSMVDEVNRTVVSNEERLTTAVFEYVGGKLKKVK